MENAISTQLAGNPFINRVDIELKRAQRYQIFVSLLVYDLSFLSSYKSDNGISLKDKILVIIRFGVCYKCYTKFKSPLEN